MDLQSLQNQLERQNRAPTELWNPPYCGEMDLVIKSDGSWWHEGSKINRLALIKLFASVITLQDDKYYLVTPAEKVGITVEDLPFLVTSWKWHQEQDSQLMHMLVETNIEERYIIGEEHPIVIDKELPAVKLRDNLLARVHRNVYYQWSDHVQPANKGEDAGYYLQSGSQRFKLD
ncbi:MULTISPECIES: DUF1285 domain-containing protein [Gammaproteobacteria]|uniref:DUF1285 domain-containing protein n=1 Tax=Gammaproteobacteria TaxID=1236 RepID=UPI000DD0AC9E|nr:MULTISPECIES: DUF1285 domain-containing protein [Gammaproteobacteria]RTE85463.1 DUF1285 domain-containing protein [Aliidiomarina sp. B3213]TCZ89430.1 DUF1285 domain-containing protein [Lysobacter sp. N42]